MYLWSNLSNAALEPCDVLTKNDVTFILPPDVCPTTLAWLVEFPILIAPWTLASNTERHRLYVNGTQIPSTSASSFSEVTHNSDMPFTGNGQRIWLGKAGSGNNHYYDGYMADFAYSEGYNYGPEAFGEVDSTTGNWIPRDPTTYHSGSGIAYGNNGFLLQFFRS